MDLAKLKAPSSEEEITKHWKYTDKVYVSVICTTYNQESYIRDAIESFLAQETEYRFEIVIHDDASTDGTRKIIEKYYDRFPSIISPVLQKENKHSQGQKISALAVSFSKGEYIAFCEGDDYWCDSKKLDKQYNALQENKNILLCVHDAFVINEKNEESDYKFPKRKYKKQIIPHREIFLEKGQFSPTASMMVHSSIFKPLPDFYYNTPVGDFFIEIMGGVNGVLYLPKKMSVYRRGSAGSWSVRVLKNVDRLTNHNLRMITSLDSVKKELDIKGSLINKKKRHNYLGLADIYWKKNKIESIKYFLLSLKAGLMKDHLRFFVDKIY
ncbi:glycosyltransferase [Endozoicomonas gorgoniicola]|uniref:Glycosyltransferase n=1 Tax=Endozoicomonas gorgoniicola TaxID=1234144 RepID=A0ABT3MPU8_9GAMM|nr:glycosyltransferase [Endozoicomonas gorgoniicola]MCW7551386.1 glycosyltransferase [Endozoicomonas gorgoniicola]